MRPVIPKYVIKKDTPKPFAGSSLKIMKARRATNIGAEFTIIVAFDTEVIFILKCQRIRSVVKAREAIALYKIVFLFLTLKIKVLFNE